MLWHVDTYGEHAQLKQLTEAVEHFACGLSICEITRDGALNILYISSAMASIFDMNTAELANRLREDILYGVHPDDRAMVMEQLMDTVEHCADQEIAYRFITDAGPLKWIKVYARTAKNDDGSAYIYSTFTDVTELKKAEQLIDVALVNTGVSIWEYDFKERCIIQYQNSAEMHGFERIVPNVPQSLVESGFVHPDSADAFMAMYDKLFAGAPFAEGVFKVQTSDRRGYWFEHIRYTSSFDENGRPYRAVGMSTDETQRQEAIVKYERELEKERGFMADEGLIVHAAFDLTTGAVLDYRYQDGTEVPEHERTTFASAKARAELLIDKEERARFLELNDATNLLARFAAGESEFKQEYRRTMPDGVVTWVRNTLRLLRDPRSGDVLLFEYWYDIESEKMMELMFRSIATDNYDFVARIDGRTKRFYSLARDGLTFHMPPHSGSDADAVTMALYNECVAPEDRAMAIENSLVDCIHSHLRDYGRFVFTYRMTRPDGAVRHKKVTQYYIDAQREIIAVMREDVTDLIREEADKNRVLSEALEAANQASRAKSQFLSRVSHELRTPLNAIIGFMELAKDADAEQTASYLSNSGAAARQLLSIINDVLDVSSIESGKLKLAHAPFDFRQLIKGVTDLYEPQCRQKGLGYETILMTPVDKWLMGDQLRVTQILFNLMNNALKFTESGYVWLRISQRQMRNNKVAVRFEISDTGCGVSEEMQRRIFKPFEQESAITAQKYGGNGLGLSIVKSLASMMGGSVDVQNRPSGGAAFTVEIPFIKCAAATGSALQRGMTPADFNLNGMRILLAEDNAMNRMVAENIIKKFGAVCECAADGRIASDTFLKSPSGYYDVILMDIQMPNMDGYEATKLIRSSSHPDARKIQIIAVTANAFSEDVTKSLLGGMNAHVSKPIEPNVLGAALAQALVKRRGV